MSDNIRTLVITLQDGTDSEWVEKYLIPAISIFPRVIKVDIEPSARSVDYWALENAKADLRKKLWEIVK